MHPRCPKRTRSGQFVGKKVPFKNIQAPWQQCVLLIVLTKCHGNSRVLAYHCHSCSRPAVGSNSVSVYPYTSETSDSLHKMSIPKGFIGTFVVERTENIDEVMAARGEQSLQSAFLKVN